jgi:hypothetical protein
MGSSPPSRTPIGTCVVERFPHLTRKEIMALIKLPTGHLRHTRAVQEWME